MSYKDKTNVSVIGLGKLGLCLATVLASKKFGVLGLDINQKTLDALNSGISPLFEPQVQDLLTQNREQLTFTKDYTKLVNESDISFLILPTPSDSNGYFSNDFLVKALEPLCLALANKKTYHMVVIVSTVMPGTMDSIIKTMIEKNSGKKIGEQIGLCYNPEFIAIGSVISDMLKPDFVLIGESDPKAGNLLENIYKTICLNNPPIKRMNFVNAELAKLAVNSFITTKISYANMLGNLCEKLPGADVDIVTNALGSDSRIGSKYLTSAVAYGGPCFPRDNIAFSALAKNLGAQADIPIATNKINQFQPERIEKILSQFNYKRIGVWGLAYKPGTIVMECSPGVNLAEHLAKQDYNVTVYDDIIENKLIRQSVFSRINIANSSDDLLQSCDVIILMMKQQNFLEKIRIYSPKLILDCWRSLAKQDIPHHIKLVHLGKNSLEYLTFKDENYATQ